MFKLSFRVAGVLIALLTVVVIAVPISHGTLVNPPHPFSLFTYKNCSSVCWLGIELGKTPKNEIVRMYQRIGTPTQVIANEASGRGVWTNGTVHGFHGAVFLDENNAAAEVFLVRYDSCLLDFVGMYGEPDFVTSDGRFMSLFYEDDLMAVSTSTDRLNTPRIGVRIMGTHERFNRRVNRRSTAQWQQVATELEEHCP